MQNRRRNDNEKTILAKIREYGPMTKYDLAERMNVSIPTVTTNVNKLLNEKVLEEAGVAEVDYGRKPILIDINYNRYFSIGIDIQKKSVYYCLMNLKLEIVLEKIIMNAEQSIENCIRVIVADVLEEGKLKKENIIGIGISYPGLVEEEKLLLKKGPNISVSNLSLEALRDELEINFYVGNEARLAAFAENIIGVSKQYMNSLYISIKEGIGAGIIVDKRYYAGSSEAAGEIGHMVIQKDGKLCNCGNRGCVEPYLSTHTLIAAFSSIAGKTLNSLEEVFAIYDINIESHKQAMKEYVGYLVLLLNNGFLIFDPDCVIIGGKMSEYQVQIEPLMKETMADNPCSMLKANRKIEFSALGYKASKYGAALRAIEEITALV
ncbi:ROK family transcriptional regulator [Cellulosilyticum sp. I15G10I2]|uniref:ROK family transcriptional regulator n=1 Tax=Cellulosilyticum sp. I15G10I2 TaxID=1892843 RepID=UPI00085C4839|nr:ROK family transcriptional regulator [Cellulosilyticum sp. I15G10I2]